MSGGLCEGEERSSGVTGLSMAARLSRELPSGGTLGPRESMLESEVPAHGTVPHFLSRDTHISTYRVGHHECCLGSRHRERTPAGVGWNGKLGLPAEWQQIVGYLLY